MALCGCFSKTEPPPTPLNVTQSWFRDNLPRFWSKEMWPPCSPDLNPMDFSIWSILEAKACSKVHRTVKDLKRFLELAWQEIPQSQLRPAVEDVRRRLESVVASKGSHFEQTSGIIISIPLCIRTYLSEVKIYNPFSFTTVFIGFHIYASPCIS